MKKIVAYVLCMLVVFYAVVHGDTITLRNDGKDIDLKLKVTGVMGDSINAIVLKKDLKSLNMQFLNTKNYPDLIFLNSANTALECKVKKVTEDAIHVLIPTAMLSSLTMSFQSGDTPEKKVPDKVENKPRIMDVVAEKEKTEQLQEREPESEIHEDTDKNGIVNEIRTSPLNERAGGEKYYRLRTKKAKTQSAEMESDPVKTGKEGMDRDEPVDKPDRDEKMPKTETEASELEQKLTNESPDKRDPGVVEEHPKKEKAIVQDTNLGRVEGRILHGGKSLPDCQVKLQMLEKGGLLRKGYRPVEGAVELEAVTDKDGIYRFANVPPGMYKLYWKPPSETTWVRRFKMEPDVTVDSGRLASPKNIETLKRTLN